MGHQPIQETHYGKLVWVNPTTESIRRKECLCLNCAVLNSGQPDHCPTAKRLYEECVGSDIALIITRCPRFEKTQEGDGKL